MKTSERHRIKQNDLAQLLESAMFYLGSWVRPMILGVAAIVVLTVGGIFVHRWMNAREERAAARLGEVIRTYRAPIALSLESLQRAPPGAETFTTAEERDGKVVALADDLLDSYGSTRAAPKALYYKALAHSGLGEHDEAVAVLDRLLREFPGDFLSPMARYRLGWVLETQGNPSEALIHFQTVAEDTRGLFPREEGFLGIARCQEALGQTEEAVQIYRRVIDEFPGSEYVSEAQRRLDERS